MEQTEQTNKEVRVCVRLTERARAVSEYETERLWADAVGDGLYKLTNVPFLAYNLNIGDIVRCTRGSDEELVVDEVVERSGTGTLRLFFAKEASDEEIESVLAVFEGIPAKIEKGRREHWAVATKTAENLKIAVERLRQLSSPRFDFETGYDPNEPWAGS